MLSYRIDAVPMQPAHQISADLRALLEALPLLTISLVQLRAPFRDSPIGVSVLSVPEAGRLVVERRLAPRWFGEAPAALQQVREVAMRPEWSWSALLVPHPGAVPLGVIIAAHWPSARLDLHVTTSGCAARLWACGPPTPEACTAIRAAGWRLVPLQRLPRQLHPLLLHFALLIGRVPDLTLELGVPVAAPPEGEAESLAAEAGETDTIFPPELPPAETPAACLLAEAWSAAQQPPSAEEEDGPPPSSAGDDGAEEEDQALSPWPAGPGRLSPRQLEAVLERVLSDPDVAERGLTKNKLKAAGAGPDAEALLAWLDAAGLLAEPSKADPVVRWREPRALQLRDAPLIAGRLRATPLPDEATVAQVRAAFAPTVPPGGHP